MIINFLIIIQGKMKNKVILHGATNCQSSNYGDFLYGEMFYKYFLNKGDDVEFYQASDFFIKYLSNDLKNREISKRDADYIVYIPGGYFGESSNSKWKEVIVHFLRFLPLGLWAANHKKKILVAGIGAGPINNLFLKSGIKKICDHADVITVRDSKSFDVLSKLSPKSNIFNCGDMILTRKLDVIFTEQINRILNKAEGKKILLIHYNHDELALEKFAICAKRFVKENPDYYIVVSSDSILEYDMEYYERFQKKVEIDSSYFKYSNPSEMTELIKHVDVVLTCKLHVGVVSCTFNKSVIVAACHYEKTRRFYEQIFQSERCVDLYKVSDKQLFALLKKYHKEKIEIPEDVVKKANESWNILEKYMGE